jgi:hypothetical protein
MTYSTVTCNPVFSTTLAVNAVKTVFPLYGLRAGAIYLEKSSTGFISSDNTYT